MSTDNTQVMRVLDRCLDTRGSVSGTVPGVAAAAARAKADPDMHHAITALLAAINTTISWDCWRRALAAAREAQSDNYTCSLTERCDRDSPIGRIFVSCEAASEAVDEADRRTAAALAELSLAAVALEMSSLGTDRSRKLRNLVAHGDVAAARDLSRSMADR